jgi:hypothetical protein
VRAGALVGWEGCEVRLCDPCAAVCPRCVPVCPGCPRRCLLTARGSWRGRACALAVRVGYGLVVRFEIRVSRVSVPAPPMSFLPVRDQVYGYRY